MRKTKGMNKHQKAVYRVGEHEIGREQVAEMIELSQSADAEDRLVAAQNLCPCHVKGRIPAAWDAIYRMMTDSDRRVRQAAWHTLEDGGLPKNAEEISRLEEIYLAEPDVKVRHFAEHILKPAVTDRVQREMALLHAAARPAARKRGRCDFCGIENTNVDFETNTHIPSGSGYRPAMICDRCNGDYSTTKERARNS
jgi:hypothetical protein